MRIVKKSGILSCFCTTREGINASNVQHHIKDFLSPWDPKHNQGLKIQLMGQFHPRIAIVMNTSSSSQHNHILKEHWAMQV